MNSAFRELVSVIIPCFNDAAYLDETLSRLKTQDYRPLQIIIVDDGSADHTRRVVEKHTRNIEIEYIYQSNTGPAAARNVGILQAKGKYIQFLDADDYMTPEKIQLQVEALRTQNSGTVAYCDYEIFRDVGGQTLGRLGPKHTDLKDIDFSTAFNQWTVLHRFLFPTEIIQIAKGFDGNLTHAEDLDLWLRLIEGSVSFVYQDAPLVHYRFRRGWSVQGKRKELLSKLAILERVERQASARWANHLRQVDVERDKLLGEFDDL